MATVKLSKRTIDALSVERGDKVFWDRELAGFGMRVHATGRKIFVAQARTPGGLPKRVTIGRSVDMTAEAPGAGRRRLSTGSAAAKIRCRGWSRRNPRWPIWRRAS